MRAAHLCVVGLGLLLVACEPDLCSVGLCDGLLGNPDAGDDPGASDDDTDEEDDAADAGAVADAAGRDAARADAATDTGEPTDDICESFGWYHDRACDDFCPLPDPDCDDACVQNGWYGDRACDTFCPLPDPDCDDVCVQLGYYGDGFCDTNCAQPDPDCEATETCPEHASAGSDGQCYCDAGYVPDGLGQSCVAEDEACPPHAHLGLLDGQCYCDTGYVPDAAGTACVAEAGGTTTSQTLGTLRSVFTLTSGQIAAFAALEDQVFVVQKDYTDMYHYPRAWVHRVDAPSGTAWDLTGELEIDATSIAAFAGMVYVNDHASGNMNRGKVLRIPNTPGAEPAAPYTLIYNLTGPRNLKFQDGWVYFSQAGDPAVYRTRATQATNASERVAATGGRNSVTHFDLDAARIITHDSLKVAIGDLDDFDNTSVDITLGGATDVALGAGEVFVGVVTVFGGGDAQGSVTRYSDSLGSPEVIAGGVDSLSAVRVFGDYVYIGGADGIFRVRRDGGELEVVTGSCLTPGALEVNASGVFFACWTSVYWIPFV